jgi:ATP-dependent exoDNAse (exonuclease V) alpha subunit
MANYYLNVSVISRGRGRSALAAAAYCSKTCLRDDRLGREYDFSGSCDALYSEILLPQNAPERWLNRQTLWNEVEATEERQDSQLAKEIEAALPLALSVEEGIRLARDFVMAEFVSQGILVDLNLTWALCADGARRRYFHAMFTLREISVEGFGKKRRVWNGLKELSKWRQSWAMLANKRLADGGHKERIDDRPDSVRGRILEASNSGVASR